MAEYQSSKIKKFHPAGLSPRIPANLFRQDLDLRYTNEAIDMRGPVNSRLMVDQDPFLALIQQNPEKWFLMQNIIRHGKAFFDRKPLEYLERLEVKISGTAHLKRTAIVNLGKPLEFEGITYKAIKLKGILIPPGNNQIPLLNTGLSQQPTREMIVENGVPNAINILGRGEGVMEIEAAKRQFFYDRLFHQRFIGESREDEDLTFGIGIYERKIIEFNPELNIEQEFKAAYLLTMLSDSQDLRGSDRDLDSVYLVKLMRALRDYHQVGCHGYPTPQNSKLVLNQVLLIDREDTKAWQEIPVEDRIVYAAFDLMKIFSAYLKLEEKPEWKDFLRAYFQKASDSQIEAYASKRADKAPHAYLDFQPQFWPEGYQLDASLCDLILTELGQELSLPYIPNYLDSNLQGIIDSAV